MKNLAYTFFVSVLLLTSCNPWEKYSPIPLEILSAKMYNINHNIDTTFIIQIRGGWDIYAISIDQDSIIQLIENRKEYPIPIVVSYDTIWGRQINDVISVENTHFSVLKCKNNELNIRITKLEELIKNSFSIYIENRDYKDKITFNLNNLK